VSNIHCFTIASLTYFPRVRVLVESLRKHHPDWTLWLCVVDVEPEGRRIEASTGLVDRVLHVDELDLPDFRAWMFQHNVIEASTAVKARMLQRILDDGADKVIYLDPDIAVVVATSAPHGALAARAAAAGAHAVLTKDGGAPLLVTAVRTADARAHRSTSRPARQRSDAPSGSCPDAPPHS